MVKNVLEGILLRHGAKRFGIGRGAARSDMPRPATRPPGQRRHPLCPLAEKAGGNKELRATSSAVAITAVHDCRPFERGAVPRG